MDEVRWSVDVGQADWIGPRLSSFSRARVDAFVPGGFAAYARVLHPASYGDDETPIRWDEVAARAGLRLREGGCFPEVALLPAGHDAPAAGLRGPLQGVLDRAGADALVEILRPHTGASDDCWFCLWDGYGWEEPSVPQAVLDGPLVHLPDRDYLLYRGETSAALAFLDPEQQMPNLWWPADRSWCVATELYAEWTYVGGSEELVEAVTADGRLEAHRIEPADHPRLELPGWLSDQVEEAVRRVLDGGTGVVSTSQGTTTTTRRSATATAEGELETEHARPDGTVMGSDVSYDGRATRDDVRHQITCAILDLLM